jgi:hypothetical protein
VEKAVIGIVVITILPVAVMLLSFGVYWSYCKTSLSEIGMAIIRSVRRHGTSAYLFFCWRTLIDVGCGIIIPFFLLKMPISYPMRLSGVVIALTVIIIWLRGVGFEFNNSNFWNETSRRFRY